MDVSTLAKQFALDSVPAAFEECSAGHINSTYFVTCEDGTKYVLQKINGAVFRQPERLMNNVVSLTQHLQKKFQIRTLNFRPTRNGAYCCEYEGEFWRLYDYIGGVVTCEAALQAGDLSDAGFSGVLEQAGRALGAFQRGLLDFDASSLFETIPQFHHTPARYQVFEAAVANDVCGRVRGAAEEIRFVREHRRLCWHIADLLERGELPLRVTHNDPKLSNILLDAQTGEAVCMIDLDTVMPGSYLCDYGDAVRSILMNCGPEGVQPFKTGYLDALNHLLSDVEIQNLSKSVLIMALELGIRYLTDYLNGDVYFRAEEPLQNLEKARKQFQLVRDVESLKIEL